jgi:hypothetical protein
MKFVPFSKGPILQETWKTCSPIFMFNKGTKYFPNNVSSCPEKPNKVIGFSHSITKILWISALS